MSQGRDEALIDAAIAGEAERPRVCTLVGPPGIGKTELLRRVRRRWRSEGRRVVRVVGSELETSVPLGVVDQLLAMLGETSDRDAEVEGAEENLERRVASAVLRSLDALAVANVLVVIDDAHWIDETSRRILDFVLRRLDDEAPATVIAERPGRPLTTVGVRLAPQGLSLAEASEMVASNGRRDDAGPLLELSGGNPLALQELLAAEPDQMDEGNTERRLLQRRIERLPGDTQLALALLGRRRVGDDVDAAWSRLSAMSECRGAPTLRDAIHQAAEIGLVDITPSGQVGFRHPEYRATASVAVDRSAQRSISSALADTTTDDDSAAWHRSDATDRLDDDVASLLAASGRRTAERGAPIEAARAFEAAAAQAADPMIVIDHRIDAARCWFHAGELAEVARVTADCDGLPVDQLRRIRARQYHRFGVGWSGHVDATVQGFLEDAEVAAEFSIDDASALRLSAFVETLHAGRIDRATEIAAQLEGGLVDVEDDAWSGAAAVVSAFADLLGGRIAGDDTPSAAVLRFAATLEPRKLETPGLSILQLAGYSLMVLERWNDAADALQRLTSEERRRGATVMSDFTDATFAEVERRRGRWASAMSRCTDDLSVDPRSAGAGPASQRAVRARMLACRGDSLTLEFTDAVRAEAGPPGMVAITGAADIARATHHLVIGQPDVAADLMEALDQRTVEGAAFECGVLWYELDAIESFAATGRREALERLVRRLERHAEASGRRWSSACAALGRFLVDASLPAHQVVAAARQLDEAFEVSRIELLMVEALLAADRSDVVAGLDLDLDELRTRLARFGAAPFVARCDAATALLRAAPGAEQTGSRTPSPSPGGSVGVLTELTPAELRVAVAVAGGRTNAEAADDLYLSIRTIEAHLRAIFRKLGLRNRVELATAMAGHVSA